MRANPARLRGTEKTIASEPQPEQPANPSMTHDAPVPGVPGSDDQRAPLGTGPNMLGRCPLDGDLACGMSAPDAHGDLPPLPVNRPKVAKGAKGAALNGPARTLVRIPHPEDAPGANARPGEPALGGGVAPASAPLSVGATGPLLPLRGPQTELPWRP